MTGPDNQLRGAAAALAKGDTAAARSLIDKLPAPVRSSAPGWQLQGLLAKAEGRLSDALAALQQAVELAPGDPAALSNLGNLQRQVGALQAAEASYRAALAAKPDFIDAQRNLALLLAADDRPAAAVPLLQAVVAARPQDGAAVSTWAHCLRRAGRLDEALAAYRTALALRPGHPGTVLGLAKALRQQGDTDTARQCLTAFNSSAGQANGSAQVRVDAAVELAAMALDDGQPVEAERLLAATCRRYPAAASAQGQLAELRWQVGQAQHARDLVAAQAAHPADPALAQALVEHRLAVGEGDGAMQVLADHRQAAGGLAPALVALQGRAHTQAGQHAAALATLRAAVQQWPESWRLQLDLAQAALQQQELVMAEGALATVARVQPHNQLLWACRGLLWQLQGDDRLHWLHRDGAFVHTRQLPCPPGFANLPAFLADLQQVLEAMHRLQQAPTGQSVRGGTQTPGLLFSRRDPLVQALRGSIEQVVADWLQGLPREAGHPLLGRLDQGFRFAGSWSVRLAGSGHHANHVHPAGWISSAFYVAVPEDLQEPAGFLAFGESGLGLGAGEQRTGLVRPVAGELTLFPSYTWHGTVPFSAGQPRITTPFDVVPAPG